MHKMPTSLDSEPGSAIEVAPAGQPEDSPFGEAVSSSRAADAIPSLARWLSYITLEGSFATVFIIFTGGAFLTGLALMFGANDFEIGLLAAIPFLAQSAQLVSAYAIDRTGLRKPITVWSSVVGRQIWWLILPIIFMGIGWKIEALLGVVVFSNAAIMLATPGWMSWVADLVPERIRGRFFGGRNAAIAATTMASLIAGGVVLDQFRAASREGMGFATIIILGCLFAAVAAYLLGKLPDRPQVALDGGVSWSHLMQPLKDGKFRRLIMVFFAWNMAIGLSAPFFIPHMLNNLKMSFTLIAVYSSAAAIMAIALNKPWGVMIDRFGTKPVLVFCSLGIALVPAIWLFPRHDFLWILAFEAVFSGALWTGFTLAAFIIPIASCPKERRIEYLAVFAVVTGLGFFTASLLGGIVAQTLSGVSWHVGKQTVVNYHLIFAGSTGLRLLTVLLLLGFREPEEKALPVMVQFMGYSVQKWLSTGLQILPWYRKLHDGAGRSY